MFRPYSQGAWPVMTIVAKTATDPSGYVSTVRSALQGIDPDLPVARVSTMEAIERNSTGSRRFPMMLLGAFGAVAFTLAVLGVYGVVSYVVTQRTREIGIRVALGARRGQVLRLVVMGAMRPVLAGLAIGAVGAVFAARLLGYAPLQRQARRPGRSRRHCGAARRRGDRRLARARRARDAGRSDHRVEDGIEVKGRLASRPSTYAEVGALPTATSAGRRISSPIR